MRPFGDYAYPRGANARFRVSSMNRGTLLHSKATLPIRCISWLTPRWMWRTGIVNRVDAVAVGGSCGKIQACPWKQETFSLSDRVQYVWIHIQFYIACIWCQGSISTYSQLWYRKNMQAISWSSDGLISYLDCRCKSTAAVISCTYNTRE